MLGSSCMECVTEAPSEETTDAVSLDKERHFIVEDSAGGFYLVGLAGLEPAT